MLAIQAIKPTPDWRRPIEFRIAVLSSDGSPRSARPFRERGWYGVGSNLTSPAPWSTRIILPARNKRCDVLRGQVQAVCPEV